MRTGQLFDVLFLLLETLYLEEKKSDLTNVFILLQSAKLLLHLMPEYKYILHRYMNNTKWAILGFENDWMLEVRNVVM